MASTAGLGLDETAVEALRAALGLTELGCSMCLVVASSSATTYCVTCSTSPLNSCAATSTPPEFESVNQKHKCRN